MPAVEKKSIEDYKFDLCKKLYEIAERQQLLHNTVSIMPVGYNPSDESYDCEYRFERFWPGNDRQSDAAVNIKAKSPKALFAQLEGAASQIERARNTMYETEGQVKDLHPGRGYYQVYFEAVSEQNANQVIARVRTGPEKTMDSGETIDGLVTEAGERYEKIWELRNKVRVMWLDKFRGAVWSGVVDNPPPQQPRDYGTSGYENLPAASPKFSKRYEDSRRDSWDEETVRRKPTWRADGRSAYASASSHGEAHKITHDDHGHYNKEQYYGGQGSYFGQDPNARTQRRRRHHEVSIF